MNGKQERFARRALVLALQAALTAALPAAAVAADGDAADPRVRESVVEVGVLNVDKDSAKFGEYNGLDKKGAYAIGNFGLYGGDGDAGAFRWKAVGTQLGLDTRNVVGEVGTQGRWRVTASYDEIPHRISDHFLTLWNGAGSTTLTLPSGYPAASTRLSVTNSAGGLLANWNNIQSPNATATTTGGGPASVIPANLKEFDVGTQRKIGKAVVSYLFAPGWEVKGSVRREDKDGTKLTGVNIGRFSGVSAILPEPISSTTDIFEVGLAHANPVWHFNASYYASIYRNDIKLWTVENPGANNAVLGNIARLQSYPDNEMHQVNLSGGYKFSPMTRLTLVGTYSRLTQDDTFIDPPAGSTWVVPVTSPHAKVINTYLLTRFSTRFMPQLNFNASYKFEQRDNKTPIYNFLTTGGDSPGASTQFSNTPLNRKLQNYNLDLDYLISRGQGVKLEYEYEQIRRTANGDESPFRADKTYDDTIRVEYRRTLADALTGRISYARSQRRVKEYEEGNPRPTSPPAPLPAADPQLTGFEQFFLADRDRDKLRSQLNFEATEALSLSAKVDYNRDHYPAQYGLKESKSWTTSLDASLSASENLVFNAFYTYEDMRMQLDSLAIARGLTSSILVPHVSGPPCAPFTNAANTLPADYFTDPCRQWSESQSDKVHTIGLAFLYKGLMGGRLVLAGDVSYAHAVTPIGVSGGTYYSNGVPNSATANFFIAASNFPDITSTLTTFRLAGTYAIDSRSAIRLIYQYSKLKSADWQYDAYTNSALGVLAVQNYIGPGITAPNYNVNVVGVSYIYRFR
jgi:MtrB/PioB family decaheme-associated outer membrane protein